MRREPGRFQCAAATCCGCWIGRRSRPWPAWPALEALAQSRKDTLVIGIDTSDSTELDPVRDLHYTPPMTISACYDAWSP